jgi:serine protease Do
MATVLELQSTITGAVERVGPSVVGIGHRWAQGSGVVIASGKVLTNAHNLRGEDITVTFADGRTAQAQAAGVDLDGDLAVLDVDTADAPAVGWASASASIGLPVVALANPGGRGLRATFGLVSATQRSFSGPRGRRISGSLEHTAPLLPGSSGGPVVDADGALLGINTNRLGEGFYLAIPADEALQRKIDALGRGESPSRPRLGVALAPAHVARRLRRAVGLPEADGLLVRGVEDDSPAANAGIREGDLITQAGGKPVREVNDLYDAMESGQPLTLTVLRGAEEVTVEVALG